MAETYYQQLGIAPDAGEMDVRRAYGRRILELREDAPEARTPASLDEALATLTDPTKRAAYDASLVAAMAAPSDAKVIGDMSFKYARNGALWFAAGGVGTALTYVAAKPGDKYWIAWGAVLFGAIQLVRGLSVYLSVRGPRTLLQIGTLVLLVSAGALSAGWVVLGETHASQEAALLAEWNAAVKNSDPVASKADVLWNEVNARTTEWSSRDASDLRQVSSDYSRAADILANAGVPERLIWYRDGLVQNFRDAAQITSEFGALPQGATQRVLDALSQRWRTRLAEFDALQTRFDAEQPIR